GIKYVESTFDDFSTKETIPQIAVSVDMLDTGIDIPELVNLVFFKKVCSKSKFWQMLGRGTRLCEDLFGVGLDKESFRIFDYCSNFEYFRENKKGKEATLTKSLTENLFNMKVSIIKELQQLDYQEEKFIANREELVDELIKSINLIDETRFNSRMKIRYIHKYNQKQAWEALSDEDVRDLEEQITPLIHPIDDNELAKRFDYLMLTIEDADLKGEIASKPKMKVVTTADKLAEKGSMAEVKRQQHIIAKVQTNEFWDEANIFDYEEVRIALRDLIKFIETVNTDIYFTDFKDEVLEVNEHEGDFLVNELQSYKKKVDQYLKEHQNDIVVFKLRNNKVLSMEDIKHLEEILWNRIGTKKDYKETYGDEPLAKLVRKIVGLEPKVANEIFSDFLSNESLNKNQMEFVKRIVDFVIKNGIVDKMVLSEHPFNKHGSIANLFEGKIDIAKRIISRIDEINANAGVS
ncbi:MAG: type I restriction-modification enzyme R subunit C-terminal domain-containing protein, partial [Clostridia bacterium]|nr:type I restriction-modification enzyme R subunit C-terminal domain-containing protein [Clostridia bacterium]